MNLRFHYNDGCTLDRSRRGRRLQIFHRVIWFSTAHILLNCVLASEASADEAQNTEIVPQIVHSVRPDAVTFSPDGRFIVSASQDGTLKLWDVATGALIRSIIRTARDGQVVRGLSSVAFSYDSKYVLSAGEDKTPKLWDVVTGKFVRGFEGHSEGIRSVAFSRDGRRLLTASWDKTMKLWDLATGRSIRTIEMYKDVWSVAYSPDGRFALSANFDKTLTLWDLASGAAIRVFEGHTNEVRSVAFSPNGRLAVSGSADSTLKLWDVTTGSIIRSFVGHASAVGSVAFSPNGRRILSGSQDGTVKLWDAATGALIRNFDGVKEFNCSVTFSPNGSKVFSNNLQLLDAETGNLVQDFNVHAELVTSVKLSQDGHVLVGSGNTVKLWDVTTGALVRSFEGHTDVVSSVALSPDGRLVLSGSRDTTLKLWDAATGKLIRSIKDDSWVFSVGFSRDGRRVFSATVAARMNETATVKLWDASSGRLIHTFEGGMQAAFSPDGHSILTRDPQGQGASLWDIATGAVIRSFSFGEMVSLQTFSPDGRFVLGNTGTMLKLWDVATGSLVRRFDGKSSIRAAIFSPDGNRILSGGSDGTIRIWETETGQLVRSFEQQQPNLTSVAFSRDGKRIVSGSGNSTIDVWAPSGRLLAQLSGSPKGEWIAITRDGFFNGSSRAGDMLAIVRGVQVITIAQVHQSLFSPDLVRESLAGDPDGEVKRAVEFINLDKVVDSGPAPVAEITSHPLGSKSDADLIEVTARIKDSGTGVGRIEWRVNGITAAVAAAPSGVGPDYEVKQTLALDPGDNAIEVVAYNGRNLLASRPAQTTISYTAPANAVRAKLYVLAIGINDYHDLGWKPPEATAPEKFPPLRLAADDAKSLAEALKQAGAELYGDVSVRTAVDSQATAAGLDRIIGEIAAQIGPRDTFVLFAAAHGYSNNGRFYLIPQDYQGGTNPEALAAHAIDQLQLQDWIANRIKAKKAVILLDTCESGALTNGYAHSRVDAPASEAAVGRLHEATGRPVLTAAAAGKPAFEGYHGHGVFTWALIDALFHGDTNGDGLIELSELATHVRNTVPKISAELNGRGIAEVITQLFRENRQTAHFGSPGGDFALVRRLQ
jgi:WD40 repeat protein